MTAWLKNNYNSHIAQYLNISIYQPMKFGHAIEYNKRNVFLQKSCRT